MKTIGLFGGAFNPFHNGHLKIIETVLSQHNVNKLVLVPSARPPHKDPIQLPSHYRIKMIQLAVAEIPHVEISTFELERDEPSYSYYTLQHFKSLYPNDELFFILGSDAYNYMPHWFRIDEVLKLCSFLVTQRKEHELLPALKSGKFIFTDMDIPNVSSSEIREKIKNNLDFSMDVPKAVYDYLKSIDRYVNFF